MPYFLAFPCAQKNITMLKLAFFPAIIVTFFFHLDEVHTRKLFSILLRVRFRNRVHPRLHHSAAQNLKKLLSPRGMRKKKELRQLLFTHPRGDVEIFKNQRYGTYASGSCCQAGFGAMGRHRHFRRWRRTKIKKKLERFRKTSFD